MATRLVGRIRVNESVSPEVARLFSRFPSSMDRIEIYDNSVLNDPAPPCKAAALISRSFINNATIPCITVLRQKIFDYNNKDFHSSQLQALVDSIASNYLHEQGGGIQLTVHRLDKSSCSLSDMEIFAKTKETSDHKNLTIMPFVKMWFKPWSNRVELIQPPSDHTNQVNKTRLQYTCPDGNHIDLVSIDQVRRRLVCSLSTSGDHSAMVNALLLKHLCYEATVLVPQHGWTKGVFSGAVVINKRLVGLKQVPDLTVSMQPEFIDS